MVTLGSCAADKSRKGSVDAPIVELVNQLNDHAHIFTTSSCSGAAYCRIQSVCMPAAFAGTADFTLSVTMHAFHSLAMCRLMLPRLEGPANAAQSLQLTWEKAERPRGSIPDEEPEQAHVPRAGTKYVSSADIVAVMRFSSCVGTPLHIVPADACSTERTGTSSRHA